MSLLLSPVPTPATDLEEGPKAPPEQLSLPLDGHLSAQESSSPEELALQAWTDASDTSLPEGLLVSSGTLVTKAPSDYLLEEPPRCPALLGYSYAWTKAGHLQILPVYGGPSTDATTSGIVLVGSTVSLKLPGTSDAQLCLHATLQGIQVTLAHTPQPDRPHSEDQLPSCAHKREELWRRELTPHAGYLVASNDEQDLLRSYERLLRAPWSGARRLLFESLEREHTRRLQEIRARRVTFRLPCGTEFYLDPETQIGILPETYLLWVHGLPV